MTADASLAQVLDPAIIGMGLTLEGVRVSPAGRRRVVRVVIDRQVADRDVVREAIDPLTLDEVAAATRVVEDVLDESGVLGEGSYTLEVTSPGVSRPLTQAQHFQRNVSRLVRLALADGSSTTGRLVEADLSGITLELPATKREPAREIRLSHDAITSGEVQVEFSRPAVAPPPAVTPKDA